MTKVIHPKCKVCQLPVDERKALDRSLLRGEPVTTLSQRHGISRDSLYRHKNTHIPGTAALGVRRTAENHGMQLLEDLDDLVITARRILRKAEEDGHSKTALLAVKECRASLVSIASISHAIYQAEQQTIIEVQEQHKEQKDWIREGLKVLTPEEHKEYRRLNIKLLAAQGGHLPEEEDPESDKRRIMVRSTPRR